MRGKERIVKAKRRRGDKVQGGPRSRRENHRRGEERKGKERRGRGEGGEERWESEVKAIPRGEKKASPCVNTYQ